MTIASTLTLFLSMVILALIPGPGILAVMARSSTAGFRHGISTTIGIVAGDFVFITLALLGLAALSEILGGLFIIVKYLGAAYLIWLGVFIILSKSKEGISETIHPPSHLASFSAGLITTLSNPKAILFYFSFFPTLLDLSQVSFLDAATLYVVATLAIGSVMLGYAYAAIRAKDSYKNSSNNSYIRYGAGTLLVSSGLYVAIRG